MPVVGMPPETGGYAYAAHGCLRQLIPLSQDHVIVVRSGITDGGVDSWDEVAFDIAAKLRHRELSEDR